MRITRRGFALGSGILIGAAGISWGFGYVAPSATLRYRMTVDIDVDGASRTESSVSEISFQSNRWLPLPGNAVSAYQVSDAMFIDLGGRGVLVLLTESLSYNRSGNLDQSDGLVYGRLSRAEVISRAFGLIGLSDAAIRSIYSLSKAVELTPDLYPPMITLDDIQNPVSARFVYPDDLIGEFGKGVKLKRIMLSTTVEPITRGIEKKLPWLKGWNALPFEVSRARALARVQAPDLQRDHFVQGRTL